VTIGYEVSGSFDNTEKFLKQMADASIFETLGHYGQEGVNALASATPVDSGETANSWYYEIVSDGKTWSIIWSNSNVVDGRPIAVLLQYGHGTGTGGYVEGQDYINPALQPIFDRMVDEGWKVVTTA
jgi:hypothetical protein